MSAREIIGDTPDRTVEVLSDHDSLHVTWTRFGPGRDGAAPHIHRLHSDLFYVLDGVLTVKLADGEAVAPAGTLVHVPPLVVHGFRNAGDGELRYLNFHAPGTGFIDYMRGRRDGRPVPFDQEDPPADRSRPTATATIGGAQVLADSSGLRVVRLADYDEIRITEAWSESGDVSPPPAGDGHAEWFYVLEGELVIDGERAPAGSWVHTPARSSLRGSAPVRFLHVQAPA
jgi:mannose-6-phosphate isomerase-like protein (cupin superfamily)